MELGLFSFLGRDLIFQRLRIHEGTLEIKIYDPPFPLSLTVLPSCIWACTCSLWVLTQASLTLQFLSGQHCEIQMHVVYKLLNVLGKTSHKGNWVRGGVQELGVAAWELLGSRGWSSAQLAPASFLSQALEAADRMRWQAVSAGVHAEESLAWLCG